MANNLSKHLRKNPFWPFIKEAMDELGYKNYSVDHRGGKFELSIETIQGRPIKHVFAGRAASFTVLNFNSHFRSFLKAEYDKGRLPA